MQKEASGWNRLLNTGSVQIKYRGMKRIYQLASDAEYGSCIRRKALPFGPTFLFWLSDRFEETRTHESWKKQKKRKQWM